mmetsp:Transcript_3961/g.5990  ORF Transcript_3961/g.5990 Transcript_3961/m.5990 type:complete len:192 (+) Transcript_3961:12-587(+)
MENKSLISKIRNFKRAEQLAHKAISKAYPYCSPSPSKRRSPINSARAYESTQRYSSIDPKPSIQLSPAEEELLNIIRPEAPKAELKSSPRLTSSVMSLTPEKAPSESTRALEKKFQNERLRCKKIERSYKDLLMKHARTEKLLEQSYKPKADVSTNSEDAFAVILQELRGIKSRLANLEEVTSKLARKLNI